MTNSRTKGKVGELEVANILKSELKLDVHRNWMAQSAEGGSDLFVSWPPGYAGWAIEVKRARVPRVKDWWAQTASQALSQRVDGKGPKPVLIYRLDRQPWMAMMSLFNLRPDLKDHSQVTMGLQAWCNLVIREIHEDAEA